MSANLTTFYAFLQTILNSLFDNRNQFFGVITFGGLLFGSIVFIALVRFVAGVAKGMPSGFKMGDTISKL